MFPLDSLATQAHRCARTARAATWLGLMLASVATPLASHAQPRPGDTFREYNMETRMLRIGERWEWGGSNWGKSFVLAPEFGENVAPFDVDLEGAVRAEVTVGYDQCHGGTRGLAIAWNGHDYLRLPVPETIPEPVAGYMFWPFPTIPVPLGHLARGSNSFQLRIDPPPRQPGAGGWSQNLVYAVVLRIYYGPDKPRPEARLVGVEAESAIGERTVLGIASTGGVAIAQVDYLGCYLDFDHDGDGIYREWQYRYQGHQPRGLYGHIGTATEAPFSVAWDATWLPDQVEPMHLAARVTGTNGVMILTEEVRHVRLERPGYAVELCTPYNVPAGWVTRKGRMGQRFEVRGDPSAALEARMRFRSWGENDGAGGWINDHAFPELRDGAAVDPSWLRTGANTFETAKGGHHGLEVVWPGVVILVRYRVPATPEAPPPAPAAPAR